MTDRVRVIVCGEPLRGDDGAGRAAVALLPAEVTSLADIVEVGQLDLLALLDLPPDRPVVVVDAVSGIAPGELWVRPLDAVVGRARALAADGRAAEPRSSHELPLEQVLALAAALRDTPPRGTFVGIGGSAWELGAALSPAVEQALPELVTAIGAAIRDGAAG